MKTEKNERIYDLNDFIIEFRKQERELNKPGTAFTDEGLAIIYRLEDQRDDYTETDEEDVVDVDRLYDIYGEYTLEEFEYSFRYKTSVEEIFDNFNAYEIPGTNRFIIEEPDI